uniref:Reverse transcriptase Ty1/copia-type domain-containing protein n=1 Tax=Trichuris muris TaxID=70415 RepID=A0A5S6QKH9_TRIMR
MESPDAREWYDAIKMEILSLVENKSWFIVERPSDRQIVGSRLVLCNKFKSDGNLERRKARLVAKGYTQQRGTDFKETFAPVVRLNSIRTLMALAVEKGLTVHQLDIATAFLNGDLEEEIFMQPPDLLEKVLEEIVQENVMPSQILSTAREWLLQLRKLNYPVCKLKKAIYGLKQAGRQWYKKLDEKLRELGMKPLESDSCVYSVPGTGGLLKLVAIYVDDTCVLSNDIEWIKGVKTELANTFKVRNLGPISYGLGIQFKQNEKKGTISMCQRSYVLNLLKRFGMQNCKPATTPLAPNLKLTKPLTVSKEEMLRFPYQTLIGSLMYLAVATRPDIAYAVSSLSQFNTNYAEEHWKAAKRILLYLKGTSNFGLVYRRSGKPPRGYADADWGACPIGRRSYTGFLFKYGDAAVSWEARKQRTVALSSTEAEYMSLTEAVKETLWLRTFLREIDELLVDTIDVYNDNFGAQELARNSVFHARTKHIDTRYHFIRETLSRGFVNVIYLPTEQMPADILTKGLYSPKHNLCAEQLGLKDTQET